MPDSHFYPINYPIISDVLIEGIIAEEKARGPKPKAFDSMFRFSDALACARKLAIEALDPELFNIEPSNPFDMGSLWVMWIGTLIHEHLQKFLLRRYPHAEVEAASCIEVVQDEDGEYRLTSGSADAFIPEATMVAYVPDWSLGSVAYELKSMGAYGFDTAIGLKRMSRKLVEPEGPRASAIAQGALNAFAKKADTVVVGNLALEAVSKSVASNANVQLSEIGRIMAEFIFPKKVWLPIAEKELARISDIDDLLKQGLIADRLYPEDGRIRLLNPTLAAPYWACDYCSQLTRCRQLGPGEVPVSLLRKESDGSRLSETL